MTDGDRDGAKTPAPRGTGRVTQLLLAWNGGETTALAELVPLVHETLEAIARRHLRNERPNHTLEPHALVNEAYLRLVDDQQVGWRDRAHFFGAAAQLMRRILVDHARRRNAAKRGGGALSLVPLAEVAPAAPARDPVDVIALDDALRKLAGIFPQQASIVELRFFAGLSIEEASEALGISTATTNREWAMAKAWLHRETRSGSARA
jgi:RNA polymerase sigma-70 factor (ECF subfamily)